MMILSIVTAALLITPTLGESQTVLTRDGLDFKQSAMADLLQSVETMQSQFYQVWLGTWPNGIDWTRVIMSTHIAASMETFSRSKDRLLLEHENVVNSYFSHITAYYFGQDSVGLRFEAFDDILWVVLGWLDSIQLMNHHSDTHFAVLNQGQNLSTWHGKSFESAFAHRARLFWEQASNGWDETLCGGGMIWSPYLDPYKNSITNQLFITASIGMYLHFPGDTNDSPFLNMNGNHSRKHDRKFLDAAIKGFNWLHNSKLLSNKGLYIDGYHSKGWNNRGNGNGTGLCDVPNPMVYTYNQGVILSAHRGLWSATGNTSYLVAGHELIRNVINSTGWSIEDDKVTSRQWSGLGRNGILEEVCDIFGMCSQDGQTFKGIFFHHLTVFCQRLPIGTQKDPFHGADQVTATLHLQGCRSYAPWVARNARAAKGTRDENGVFGSWWTVGLRDFEQDESEAGFTGGADYRNQGVLRGSTWAKSSHATDDRFIPNGVRAIPNDPNQRGRGRTLESHSGGVAVSRAHYEFLAL